jgi:hypothetical protein
VTQGGPLSAKLFNIMVDAVVREWLHQLRNNGIVDPEELDLLMGAFFTTFYVDDAYLAARDPDFLQVASNSLVSLFKCVGLETNVKKMQTMICTPGQITTQLSTNSYRHRHGYGTHTREQWDAERTCRPEGVLAKLRVALESVVDLSCRNRVPEMAEYCEKVPRSSAWPHADLVWARMGLARV